MNVYKNGYVYTKEKIIDEFDEDINKTTNEMDFRKKKKI